MTTLTERYISATVKSLPDDAQEDVRAELEASIADAFEARIEQGEDPDNAERAVLTELGDPTVLAAGYTDRRLHLIGPQYYLTWWRLLKLLLMIVPATAMVAVALGQGLADAPVATIIGRTVLVGITVTVHLFFWVTVVFVILERTGTDTGVNWDLDQLPEPQSTATSRVDLVVGLALLGLAAGAILWDQYLGFLRIGGEALPVLHANLWPWAIVLIVLQGVHGVVLYLRGRWTTGLAAVNAGLAVLFAGLVLTFLVRGQLVTTEFLEAVFLDNGVGPDVLRILAILLGFGTAGVAVWAVIDGWLKAQRDSRRTGHAA
ncbi:permease prefix domain 1-containing protein [Pseudactinotalea sp. Z1739]|uniref:permease prefix domain 1-containing protein n=1 Tax=Pseudactinotalea sp. Z1739 TaxID=3413028 RepID=UPI003C7BE80B